MSDAINLKQSVMKFSRIKENVYDGVEVWADDVLIGSAPTGATLNNPYKVVFPWNTNQQGQTIAENIWSRLDGYVYNPYEADGALLDPAAQLGDLVKIDGVRSVVGKKEPVMDALYASSIAAPQATEDDTEYDVQNVQQRLKKAVQSVSRAYATLSVNVDNIIAEVTDGQGNYTVLNMNSQGVVVKGNSGQVSIKGSQIEAGSLVLTDNITFQNVSATASGAASDIDDLADGNYSGGTFIDGQSIYSPTIYANEFNVYPKLDGGQYTQDGSYNLHGYYTSLGVINFLKISYSRYNPTGPLVGFNSPGGAQVFWSFDKTTISGDVSVQSGSVVLNSDNYGTTLPPVADAKVGQIFFLLAS